MTGRRVRSGATGLVGCLALALAPASPADAALPSGEASTVRPAVVEQRVIGHSVRQRPIRAWRVGNPRARIKAVAFATMHGDEAAPRVILERIRDGRPVTGIDLWVIPSVNPDGYHAGRRTNARGVDLNRNFPRAWKRLGGRTAGPRPASEPETRAVMRFLRRVNPRFVVSFHQPLYGVDTYAMKSRPFVRRLSEHLHLPRRYFDCGGGCHGTFTQWFNHNLGGAAVTVEYGSRPSAERMRVRAPQQLVRALGGRR